MTGTLVRGLILAVGVACCATIAQAQQYAALVMDARTGRVIEQVNADTRLHPASLTKMMTLYVVFDAVRRGQLSLDSKVTISANAAAEPPSKLGLRAGQTIEVRYLIRAAALKSANDAATALGEAVAGSEAAFAQRMTQYARAMGLRNTSFKNANGLTAEGHYSSARDMAEIGRRLFYDFPQYYNIFGRNSSSAGIATVQNTNRRLLDAYPGADGIKTGYTRAAGFNLVASAERGNRRVIVSLFGGKSSASRNAEVARLMDLGLAKMPARARADAPAPLRVGAPALVAAAEPVPQRVAQPVQLMASTNATGPVRGSTAGVVVVRGAAPVALRASGRPMPRWMGAGPAVARNTDSIAAAIAEVNAELQAAQAAAAASGLGGLIGRPAPRPGRTRVVAAGSSGGATAGSLGSGSPSTFAAAPAAPRARAEEAAILVADAGSGTTGGADWGVQLGAFRSKGDAERQLLTTALQDLPELNGGLRRIEAAKVEGTTLFRAQFVGLSQAAAESACANLGRQSADCQTLAPGI